MEFNAVIFVIYSIIFGYRVYRDVNGVVEEADLLVISDTAMFVCCVVCLIVQLLVIADRERRSRIMTAYLNVKNKKVEEQWDNEGTE